MNKRNKSLVLWVKSKTAYYILFGILYLFFIWVLHMYLPFYQKSNDKWNDRTFSAPLEGELFPGNIILIDIDSWPYYKDNRDEARQARDKVVNGMIEIIALLNGEPKKKPSFIGIDMTFESYACKEIMDRLLTRVINDKNIFLAVEFDREKRAPRFPRNYFWDRVSRDIEKLKKRLMVINLEKFKDEPVRRCRWFYNGTFDHTGREYCFPSMGLLIAEMVKKYYLGNGSTFNVPNRAVRFRFRYLIDDIKADFRKYNVFSMRSAKRKLGKAAMGEGFSGSIVIFGRMDPDPGGRDRFPICASTGKGDKGGPVSLPGVLIHVNAAQSILLGESIVKMGIWCVLGYLGVLLFFLALFHVILGALIRRWKPGLNHWYGEIFLFFAVGFLIMFLDSLLKEPGNNNLEIPMFTFYMFVLWFYPALGFYEWFYQIIKSRRNKKNGAA